MTAEAEAERQRRIAKGEADAILAKYEAEAQGIQKVLEAKAQGYNKLVEIVGDDKRLVPTLLMVEQLPEIIAQQVKAVQDLKIDKVTVWDGGGNSHNGKSATSNFLSGLINSLPAVHDLAKQAGVELPEFLGQLTPPENNAIDSVPPTSHNQ
nr:flotillin domain-containing protein [Halobacteriovorax sp. DA5]